MNNETILSIINQLRLIQDEVRRGASEGHLTVDVSVVEALIQNAGDNLEDLSRMFRMQAAAIKKIDESSSVAELLENIASEIDSDSSSA